MITRQHKQKFEIERVQWTGNVRQARRNWTELTIGHNQNHDVE